MNDFFEKVEFENQVIDGEYMNKLCEYIDITDKHYAYFEFYEKNDCYKTEIYLNEDGAKINSNEAYEKITSKGYGTQILSSGYYAKIISNAYNVKITSSGESAKITSSGDLAKITSSGDDAEITSSGESAKITLSGESAKIISRGEFTLIESNGAGAKIISNAYDVKITSSGGSAKITSSGEHAKITSSGSCAEITSQGNYARITSNGANTQISSDGEEANITSIGYYEAIISSGNGANITSKGECARINITGENSTVLVLGRYSIVKAKNGTYITMCEHREDASIYTLSVLIGNEEYKDYKGRILNENEYYCLYNKKIYPVYICDGIYTIKLSEKKKDGITIIKGLYVDGYDNVYIVKDEYISAHGVTLRKAMEDFNFKKLITEGKEKIVKEIKESGKVTKPQYRAITGACEFGVNDFCKKHNITAEEISLEELRKILVEDYGAKQFWDYIDGKEVSEYIDDFYYEEDDDNEWTNFENISEDIDFSNYGDDDLPF